MAYAKLLHHVTLRLLQGWPLLIRRKMNESRAALPPLVSISDDEVRFYEGEIATYD